MKLFKSLREESELILKLKGLCPDNKIPRGLVIKGPEALKNEIEEKESFEKIKKIDEVNERYPEEMENGALKISKNENNL